MGDTSKLKTILYHRALEPYLDFNLKPNLKLQFKLD